MKMMRRSVAVGALTLGLLVGGGGTAVAADETTLYDRLGGMPAIIAVVDQFFVNNFADKRIAHRWETTDLPRLKEYIADMICDTAGGPCYYAGTAMRVAHAGMNITSEEFGWTAANLAAALDSLMVKDPERGEVLALVGSLQDQIVGT